MNPEMDFSDAVHEGMKAGQRAAIEQARRTGTKLVIYRHGVTMEVLPDELDALNHEPSS